MSTTLNYLRLYADEAGVSHFAPLQIEVFRGTLRLLLHPSVSQHWPQPVAMGSCICRTAGSATYTFRRCACGPSCCRGTWSSRPVTMSGINLVLEARCFSKTPLVPVTEAA
jgi:hypothetical protein